MSVFPKLGILNKNISKTMYDRAGNNLAISKLMSWIRITSSVTGDGYNGLVLESIPKHSSFSELYGNATRSGRVGLDMDGKEVISTGPDRGYRPSPIIESVDISNGNSGLSRKAKFSIICYTLPQAEIVAKHFLEPAYSVLVEFGWNLPQSINEKEDPSACYMASFNNYNFILNKRTRSGGTYDGFLGFITGGSYASSDNGTYVISVELTTLGEIPSYLQIHKTAVSADSEDSDSDEVTSGRYSVSEIEADGEDSSKIGDGLFKRVYNRLPNEKRTRQVKSLKDEYDLNGNKFSSEENFINVDETVREKFLKNFDEFVVHNYNKGGTYEVGIPNSISLISDQSFIRMELAFKILNSYGVHLDPTIKSEKCSGESSTPSYNYEIDINNTIIRGHKHIFSTDIGKLYIPNTELPTFGLNSVLAATEEVDIDKLIDIKNPKTVNGNIWNESGKPNEQKYAFPAVTPLKDEGIETLTDIRNQDARPYTWGYLRNLYINLDFFIEVITRSNYVAKDCYYELLNGISSACNSFWQFELVEVPTRKTINGQRYDIFQMNVVDMFFTGDVTVVEHDDTIPTFEPDGVHSPFLTSNINVDIPSVMKNSILGKRSSANIETSIEGKEVERSRFFSDKQDPVMEILDSFRKLDESDETEDKTAPKSTDIDTNRKNNLELFAQRGTLLLTLRNKSDIKSGMYDAWIGFLHGSKDQRNVSGQLGRNLIVGAFSDNTLLKKMEREFNNTLDKDTTGGNTNNPSILAIEFTFEIHGISGIKIGDVFKINRLPKNYSSGIFQVMDTSHTLSNGIWKSTVSAKLRNI